MHCNHPPRPAWNHKVVKEAVAVEFVEEVRKWAYLHGAVEEDVEDREFLAVVVLAMLESPDAYQAGRYLEDFYEWPVTGELVKIFDQAFARLKPASRKYVLEWVMKNNVRFPGRKGDVVKCRIGDTELSGSVLEVITSEAKGVVKLRGSEKLLTVNAEEVLSATPPVKPKPPKDEPPRIA